MFDDHDQNIESVLFDDLTSVNSKLITLGNNFKLIDNLYFAKNNGMIDEFIGNMQQFIKQLETHRKKVALEKLNSDILMNVYQFLDTKTLINCCGLVSKLWRESLTGLELRPTSNTIANLLSSSLINHTTKLKLIGINQQSVSALSNCNNLNHLKVLQFAYINLRNTKCIEYLMKCNMPNLTELIFDSTTIAENDAIDLLNSTFMSSVKKLDLSNVIDEFTNNFYESIAESKYLNQITHLKICNNRLSPIRKRIDLMLKDKINLEHLQILYYQLYLHPNLITNGNYKNLKYLNISGCQITNQEFVNLFISPNLPNLESIIANSLNNEIDQTVAVLPPKSQSSVTELVFIHCNPELFPSLIDHCPKLKRLTINIKNEKSKKIFENMMRSPCLSNLEFLEISRVEIVEEFFINPIYSNLKDLYIVDIGKVKVIDNVKFISNCTTLKNLTSLDLGGVYVNEKSLIEECLNALKNNPTFSKLKLIGLPEYETDDEDDEDERD